MGCSAPAFPPSLFTNGSLSSSRNFSAARSKMFRNILESDDCKASSSKDTITLSEMTRDELETFLEFMYNCSLPETKLVKHVRGLYEAADKYEVPYLQDICRNKLVASLDPSNAFDVIELAKAHSDRILEDDVYKFLTSGMDKICMSSKFESFVESHPALAVRMIRGYVRKLKREEAVQMIEDYVRKRESNPALTVQQYKRLINSCPSD